jgi:hypothetical protein
MNTVLDYQGCKILGKGKGKGKVHPRIGHEDPEVRTSEVQVSRQVCWLDV